MEFLAATKDGLIIYDASQCSKSDGERREDYSKGHASDGVDIKVVATIPSPPNAFGHAWSLDGKLLASINDDGFTIYNAAKGYARSARLPRVAPDVGGRAGGVRLVQFSPKNNFIVAYEKWDPEFKENVHVWDLRKDEHKTPMETVSLKGYSSGALPVSMVSWVPDESAGLVLVPGKGVELRTPDLSETTGLVPEKDACNYQLSPLPQKGAYYIACHLPETPGGMVGRVTLYHLSDPSKCIMEINLPPKCKDLKMLWNLDGTALLVLAASDVDETGSSYFGTTYLYWISPDQKKKELVCGAKEGQVQDLCWSPTANEFAIIVGMLPATVALYDGKTGKLSQTWGVSRRNTLKWNDSGRFCAVGGFGTLPGDLDFFDRSTEETVCSLRAALTVNCAWAPDNKHFLACTVAPRMNEGNQLTIYRYNGGVQLHIDYKPFHVEGRHEDTGAGARTKTQAILFAASWRPMAGMGDEPVTPRTGPKKKKGLPATDQAPAVKTSVAYRPKGQGGDAGGSVAAMMRGEIPATAPSEDKGRWDQPNQPKPMEEWEIRKLQKEQKKAAEEKERAEQEQEKQALRDVDKAQKDKEKKLKELKAKLTQIEAAKEKDWDELEDEDEALMETEVDVRREIAELEKPAGGA